MRASRVKARALAILGAVLISLFSLGVSFAFADVIINVLAVNSTNAPLDKDIEFSLPGEIKPADIVDAVGLQVDYNVKDAGYLLRGKVLLQPKESRTFKVKIRDVWRISDAQILAIQEDIESGFREMRGERSRENGEALKEKLLNKLDYVIQQERQTDLTIDQRIDTYRSHLQTLEEIRAKAHLIDFWRSDATEEESKKVINYVLQVSNPSSKVKKVKQQHYLPPEVRPENIVDRQGYEIRFDEKKNQPFLFKEEDLAAGEKKVVKISIRDVWFIQNKELVYIRDRAKGIQEIMQVSPFAATVKALFNEIANYLDLIESLQAMEQPDIQQHIGAFRINQKRFVEAKAHLDALEKLLARHRADLEKSRVKNVLQKIKSMKSLARVSQAIFDKKPTVNTAWTVIGAVMMFLGMFTVIHFITWFIRTAREKKQEELSLPKEDKKEGA